MPSSPSTPLMKHLLQFNPSPAPSLLLREDGRAESLELSGERHLSFSASRACIGYKSDEGWHACANRALNVKQCPTCQYRDVARVYTVGDFTLYPHLHDELSAEKYVLYLAQFGSDITKLGLTRRSRLHERWREQGADLAAALLEFDGPDDAYGAEILLQEKYGLANAVRANQKLNRLHFDKAKARSKLESMLARMREDAALSPYLSDGPITDLSPHYPSVSNPEAVDFIGGRVMGTKGAWLFFEGPSGMSYAVNLHAQVGRFLLPETEGERDSSSSQSVLCLSGSLSVF
ncbi:MAG: DUF2797 domain-containing protein [Candidatus Marsarchaeota archaeon]|nr:DUF2797 domain-containing protein [Candidatus Marsarchaeota archaeon]